MRIKISSIIFLGILLLAGCSSNKEIVILNQQDYISRYKPIIGSQNNDARTVINFGVVLKVWVAPYTDEYGVLVSSHDNYVWGDRPDFVPGTAVPKINKGSGIVTPTGSLPFSLSPSEIDRRDLKSDKTINSFINQSYKNTVPAVVKKAQRESSKITPGKSKKIIKTKKDKK